MFKTKKNLALVLKNLVSDTCSSFDLIKLRWCGTVTTMTNINHRNFVISPFNFYLFIYLFLNLYILFRF